MKSINSKKSIDLRFLLIIFTFLNAGPLLAGPPELEITEVKLISSKRINRTIFEYTYKAVLRNHGGEADNVVATVASTPTHIDVLESELDFGLVGAGQNVTSKNTITIRHERTLPFKKDMVSWNFDYTADVVTSLDGEPLDVLVDATRDFYNGDGVQDAEIIDHPEFGRIARTKLTIWFEDDATVGDINAVLAQIGGGITSMLAGTTSIVIRIPDPGSVENLNTLVEQIKSRPGVETVTHNHIASPDILPYNRYFKAIENSVLEDGAFGLFNDGPKLLATIDHHLAIKAHAMWNAFAAFKKNHLQSPIMVIGDSFGNGPIDVRKPLLGEDPLWGFGVGVNEQGTGFLDGDEIWGFKSTAHKQFSRSKFPSSHGYQVASVIGASFWGSTGGSLSEAGYVTGLVPGLDLRVIDRFTTRFECDENSKCKLDESDYMRKTLKELKSYADNKRRVILNESFGNGCDIDHTCNSQDIETQRDALFWINQIRKYKLEDRVLLVTAAGNSARWELGLEGYQAHLGGRPQKALLGPFSNFENITPLTNGLVVESHSNTKLNVYQLPYDTYLDFIVDSFRPGCRAITSNPGGHLAGIGSNVFMLADPFGATKESNGSSFAAPQVAALSAFLWAIQPELKPQDIIQRIKNTVQLELDKDLKCGPSSKGGIVDAYAAALTMDKDIKSPRNAPIRMAILDVSGPDGVPDGRFDEFDLLTYLHAFTYPPDVEGGFHENEHGDLITGTYLLANYSRFDLNGDGHTALPIKPGARISGLSRFDLDQSLNPSDYPNADSYQRAAYTTVYQNIEGHQIPFNEASLSDLQILIYYAYSELWQGDRSKNGKRTILIAPYLYSVGIQVSGDIIWKQLPASILSYYNFPSTSFHGAKTVPYNKKLGLNPDVVEIGYHKGVGGYTYPRESSLTPISNTPLPFPNVGINMFTTGHTSKASISMEPGVRCATPDGCDYLIRDQTLTQLFFDPFENRIKKILYVTTTIRKPGSENAFMCINYINNRFFYCGPFDYYDGLDYLQSHYIREEGDFFDINFVFKEN